MKNIFRFTIIVLTMIILSGSYLETSKVQASITKANPPVKDIWCVKEAK